MAISTRYCFVKRNGDLKFLDYYKSLQFNCYRYCSVKNKDNHEVEEDFRVINVKPPEKVQRVKKELEIEMSPPRSLKMSPTQDWTNVWPGPRSFHPAVVPLPLRQGVNKHGPPPSKYGNLELMKIPNFLHLTPKAIEKHCKAIKKFCTKWPEELKTDEDIEKHFPIEIITSDYCHSSPSIRHPDSRIVNLRIKLKHLPLDDHAKDKFLRLVGKRYDPDTDYVTITTDSCPLKKQNYDYAQYILTALLYESWKYEDWEKLKGDDDMEHYIFSERQSLKNVKKVFEYTGKEVPDTKEFKEAVEKFHDEGDTEEAIENYKKATLKLLSLSAS